MTSLDTATPAIASSSSPATPEVPVKRARGRPRGTTKKKQNGDSVKQSSAPPAMITTTTVDSDGNTKTIEVPVRRGRGRPRKFPRPPENRPRRPRGRPRKDLSQQQQKDKTETSDS